MTVYSVLLIDRESVRNQDRLKLDGCVTSAGKWLYSGICAGQKTIHCHENDI